MEIDQHGKEKKRGMENSDKKTYREGKKGETRIRKERTRAQNMI